MCMSMSVSVCVCVRMCVCATESTIYGFIYQFTDRGVVASFA